MATDTTPTQETPTKKPTNVAKLAEQLIEAVEAGDYAGKHVLLRDLKRVTSQLV